MKKLLIILIIPLFVGCFTTYKYKPASTMNDWELRVEYNGLQVRQMQLESEGYGKYTYTTGESLLGNTITVRNPAIKNLNKVEDRMREIEYEMSRRGGML